MTMYSIDQSVAISRVTRAVSVRLALRVCIGIPLAIIAVSYLWLAFDHGTLLLWNVIVHESGRHTLGVTILYFSHFLRELPVDVAYAAFMAAYFARRENRLSDPQSTRRKRAAARVGLVTGGAAIGLAAAALAAASAEQGFGHALQDLFQYRTRDDLSAYGSHWQYHWLSTIWYGAWAAILIRFCDAVIPAARNEANSTRSVFVWWPWIYVAALTLVFGLSEDVFTDVRYAGHQAREIATHGAITALLSLGALQLAVALRRPTTSLIPRAPKPIPSGDREMWIVLLTVSAVPLYLAIVAVSGDLMAAGQSDHGLAPMIGGHVLEHVLDYIFVVMLTLSIYSWIAFFSEQQDAR